MLNAHFQVVFGISKLQSTLLQLAYFVSSCGIVTAARELDDSIFREHMLCGPRSLVYLYVFVLTCVSPGLADFLQMRKHGYKVGVSR